MTDGFYVTAEDKYFYLEKTTRIPIKHIKSTDIKKITYRTDLGYELSISLDSFGASALAKLEPHFDKSINIALLVNGKLLYTARLFSKITTGNMALASDKLNKADLERMKLEIDRAVGLK